MILWWSDCSASTTVLLQLTSSVKMNCIWWEKKVCRSCFGNFLMLVIYRKITWKTNELHRHCRHHHHNWQRSECGWKCFNICTRYIEKLTSCWSVFHDWSYVDSLGLNACTWVVWRTGMNLFLWCGLVLFRLDETTRYIRENENTGHNEVISFDLLWTERTRAYESCSNI